MLFCNMHLPVNALFLQNASFLFTTYSGSDCGINLSLRMAEPWKALLASAVSWFWYRLLLTWCLAECHISLCCACERAHREWRGTFLPVVLFGRACYRRKCWLRQGYVETEVEHFLVSLRSWGHKKSYIDAVTGTFVLEIRRRANMLEGSVQCHHTAVSLSHVIFTLCCIDAQPAILCHTEKDGLLHMQ